MAAARDRYAATVRIARTLDVFLGGCFTIMKDERPAFMRLSQSSPTESRLSSRSDI